MKREVSSKHKLQDKRFHEEKGTATSGGPPAPEDVEIQRTRRRKQRKGTVTTEREGLDSMDWTEGQSAWRADRLEKSKPGAENLRSTA